MFTVCIPSFNHRPYLTECILSALRSPLVTEVLVIDDGSSDGSQALLTHLTHLGPRLRILPSAGNHGAHARLNELVAASQTEWVAVLNSDDRFVPGRFEAAAPLASSKKADLIFGDLVLIDQHGLPIGTRNALLHNEVPWPPRWDLARLTRDKAWPSLLALQNILATTTNMVFTRTLHRTLGGFGDYRYCHDWDFALRAAVQGRVRYVPAMMSAYRLHPGNTIKEARTGVQQEVRRMLARAVASTPGLRAQPLRDVLGGNLYLRPTATPVLAVVMDDTLAAGLLAQAVAAANLPVTVGAPPGLMDPVPYLYRPGPAGQAALRADDLRAILLTLSAARYDALLLTRSMAEGVAEAALDDALVLRRTASGTWRTGAVRQIRLYPATDAAPVAPLVPVSASAPAPAPAPASAPAAGVRIAMPAPAMDDPRPTILVLPAFLALGGVERLLITTLQALHSKWRFVIATTEPLRPEQGSTHDQVQPLAPVYDLAELTRPDDRLDALATLRDWYDPALVWIMNGAPWQVDHAAAIRAVFAGVPFVDHQAYDHEAGWIDRFGDPGLRAAERFVAINRKIADVMTNRFGIPSAQIDLVYHGADMSRTIRRPVTAAEVTALRTSFGLAPDLPTFGMIGRLSPQKRPLDLAALATSIGPRVQFVWVGPGELEQELRAAAPPNLHLLPGQPDLRPIYEMLDGLVITSAFEGLPIVLIEALAMGVPVLSTDVGAIGEVLDRYGSGVVWNPPGDRAGLVAAFKAFRRNLPAFRAAAVAAAPRVTVDFSSTRMTGDYDRVFRRALGLEPLGLEPLGPKPLELEPAGPLDPPNGHERQHGNGAHAGNGHDQRPPALGAQRPNVDRQANARKRQQERPAR